VAASPALKSRLLAAAAAVAAAVPPADVAVTGAVAGARVAVLGGLERVRGRCQTTLAGCWGMQTCCMPASSECCDLCVCVVCGEGGALLFGLGTCVGGLCCDLIWQLFGGAVCCEEEDIIVCWCATVPVLQHPLQTPPSPPPTPPPHLKPMQSDHTRHEQAIETLLEVVRQAPNLVDPYYTLASLYEVRWGGEMGVGGWEGERGSEVRGIWSLVTTFQIGLLLREGWRTCAQIASDIRAASVDPLFSLNRRLMSRAEPWTI